MIEHRLERISKVDLVFRGELLAEASTEGDEGGDPAEFVVCSTCKGAGLTTGTIVGPFGRTAASAACATCHGSGELRKRWQVVRIFVTDSRKWVVERTGYSRVAGEVPRCRAEACSTPEEVRQAVTFVRKDNPSRSYVTDVAWQALSLAARKDPRLDEALVERV